MQTDLTKIIHEDAARIARLIDLTPLHGKRVLITGATGLIGTYLTAVLEEAVRMGVNITVTLVARSFQDIERWDIGKKFVRLSADLATDGYVLSSIPRADLIFHAAGYGQPAKFMSSALDTAILNTSVLARLLKYHVFQGGTLVYTSSSEVYSGCTATPHVETSIGTTTPQHPRACYIEAKRCGEAICYEGHKDLRRHGGKAIAARVALAYGPGTKADDSRVINQFIQSAIQRGHIELRDQGLAQRTYCYVADTVELLFELALRGNQTVYNVGGHSKTTIRGLAETIGRLTGASVSVPVDAMTENVLTSAPDVVEMSIQRIMEETGKGCFYTLEGGLERTINYQKILYS